MPIGKVLVTIYMPPMNDYIKTDQILHQVCQLIAKVNKAFLPHLPDDSHTNLYYDEMGRRITGRWFTWETQNYILDFDLQEWAYRLLDERLNLILQIPHADKTIDQAQKELMDKLKDKGISADLLSDPLHFKIPSYKFSNQMISSPSPEELFLWGKVRSQANNYCRQFLGYLQKEAEIRIWPHHFDTGVYVELDSSLGLGFGLAMADSLSKTPYYYFSAYPLGEKKLTWGNEEKLKIGKWIVEEGFQGAVWPVNGGFSENDRLLDFIEVPIKWYLSQ